jgi:5'-3' exonuclease
MRAIIDGDILRYEIGFGAETGWKATHEDDPDAMPPFWYVEEMLLGKLDAIMETTRADSYTLYITVGKTFRFDIATVKPYKGTRKDKKPWHFHNLTHYMINILKAVVVMEIEADDAMAIDHVNTADETVLCSRDKDLRQVPGLFYSWELGRQPSFGPIQIDLVGNVWLSEDRKQLKGYGFSFFCAQVVLGDATDNIPGLPGCGPVATWELLAPIISEYDSNVIGDIEEVCSKLIIAVEDAYAIYYGLNSQIELVEQGRLCWMLRDPVNEIGEEMLWVPGVYQ